MLTALFHAGAKLQQVIHRKAVTCNDAYQLRLAQRQRAGLDATSASTFCITSSASAFQIRTPFSAAPPVATRMDMGVARPRAQGHAMTRTATALDGGVGKARCRTRPQTAKGAIATITTAGTNQPETISTSFSMGAPAALWLYHHEHDLRNVGMHRTGVLLDAGKRLLMPGLHGLGLVRARVLVAMRHLPNSL